MGHLCPSCWELDPPCPGQIPGSSDPTRVPQVGTKNGSIKGPVGRNKKEQEWTPTFSLFGMSFLTKNRVNIGPKMHEKTHRYISSQEPQSTCFFHTAATWTDVKNHQNRSLKCDRMAWRPEYQKCTQKPPNKGPTRLIFGFKMGTEHEWTPIFSLFGMRFLSIFWKPK